jgi:hypothetical protein
VPVTTGRRTAAAALVALVTLSSGCGLTDGLTTEDRTLPPPSASSTAAPSTVAPSQAPTKAPTDASRSARKATGPTRRVESGGIALEVPARWLELDAAQLADGAAGAPELAELAARSGITVDQFVASMKGVELALFNDDAATGRYLDNLTVLSVAAPQLTGTTVEFALMQMGASDVLSTHVSTALGDAISATYELRVGATTIHGVMVVVRTGDRASAITISAHDAATARSLAEVVTDTVEAA